MTYLGAPTSSLPSLPLEDIFHVVDAAGFGFPLIGFLPADWKVGKDNPSQVRARGYDLWHTLDDGKRAPDVLELKGVLRGFDGREFEDPISARVFLTIFEARVRAGVQVTWPDEGYHRLSGANVYAPPKAPKLHRAELTVRFRLLDGIRRHWYTGQEVF